MATVRFSDQLKNQIRVEAGRMFSKKNDSLMSQRKPEWTIKVADEYRRACNKFLSNVPSGFLSVAEQADLNGFIRDGERRSIFLNDEKVQGITIPLTAIESDHPICVEAGLHQVDRTYHGVRFILADNDPRWEDIVSEMVAHQASVKRLEEKSAEFMSGVDAILDGYTTLAPALKAWPPLWDLLPEDTQERHKEPNKRKSQAQRTEELGVDLDKMTAAVATMKLTN